ncbi:mesoderm posterior protein 2-like [Megalops cyprinoides]|uniref:mesoderm posterior protein 2-like n=1 Tax=Megalops cyprinoides TaxID=118141 RepID=UPI001864E5A2|nr:mesoderm posterior protein 2-like [Megalops cyprinoides]
MDSTLSQLLDCEALLEQACSSSDAGYYSACGSLSPASSIDSCSFSPPSLQWGTGPDAMDCFAFCGLAASEKKPSIPAPERRKSRSKYPGHKRQSASEREKLRMRDLTKALHHLRTYLPPSVAPVGQTLTKIETLRLTIRYIAHLSAQLGLTEEVLSQRHQADFSPSLHGPQATAQSSFQQTASTMNMENAASFQPCFPQSIQNFSYSHQTYQNPISDSSFAHTLPEEHWALQQQMILPGHC